MPEYGLTDEKDTTKAEKRRELWLMSGAWNQHLTIHAIKTLPENDRKAAIDNHFTLRFRATPSADPSLDWLAPLSQRLLS